MRVVAFISLWLLPVAAFADIVVPTRTIRAKEIIESTDLQVKSGEAPGAVNDPVDLFGQEAKTALYPGRPILKASVGPPALVDRNDLVTLVFVKGGLSIAVEGRALGRGAAGDRIRVMNLSSRTTVTGKIRPDGQIEVF